MWQRGVQPSDHHDVTLDDVIAATLPWLDKDAAPLSRLIKVSPSHKKPSAVSEGSLRASGRIRKLRHYRWHWIEMNAGIGFAVDVLGRKSIPPTASGGAEIPQCAEFPSGDSIEFLRLIYGQLTQTSDYTLFINQLFK